MTYKVTIINVNGITYAWTGTALGKAAAKAKAAKYFGFDAADLKMAISIKIDKIK